ncbi:MAG: alpha/beta fold hydrolase [Acidobacteriota bacterium]|nr:alpha/beta fold hydrolase [Acidobacteriota bacterium]
MLHRQRRRSIRALVPTGVLAAAFTLAAPTPAGAIALEPCSTIPGFACGALAVPLSRTGLAGGSLTLQIARRQAGPQAASSAVIGLAGGPGQAALPLATFMAQAIAPALGARDLIVFDQRGTGQSGALSCGALRSTSGETLADAQRALASCALEVGSARGAYTSSESVEDIEAIREALGYGKLVLYGTSYGTKVAEEYAQRYPQYTEALVLDSALPTDGPNPFALPTIAAVSPALGELCSGGACRGITTSPVASLAGLASRLRHHPLRGPVYDGYGHRHTLSVEEGELLSILEAGDLNPALRALFPAAVTAALRHDPAPLAQLAALSRGLVPNVPPRRHEPAEEEVDQTLFWTTTCEEDPFPWQRSAATATREGEALAALHAIPARELYPFEAEVALNAGPLLGCLDWPDLAPAPTGSTALPSIPTLILSGGQDLRTPVAQARQLASQIPGAQLLVVPYTGHSVLGSDLSGCAEAGVQSFFAGLSAGQCPAGKDFFVPTPVPPPHLGAVRPTPGLSGGPGRTLTAALDTILDFSRLVIAATLQAQQALPAGSRIGGLRGGFAQITTSSVRLAGFSFVPGVTLSGTLPIVGGHLRLAPMRVAGSAAAHGVLAFGSGTTVYGVLGGRHFTVHVAKAVLSRGERHAGSHGGGAGAWLEPAALALGPSSDDILPIPALLRTH